MNAERQEEDMPEPRTWQGMWARYAARLEEQTGDGVEVHTTLAVHRHPEHTSGRLSAKGHLDQLQPGGIHHRRQHPLQVHRPKKKWAPAHSGTASSPELSITPRNAGRRPGRRSEGPALAAGDAPVVPPVHPPGQPGVVPTLVDRDLQVAAGFLGAGLTLVGLGLVLMAIGFPVALSLGGASMLFVFIDERIPLLAVVHRTADELTRAIGGHRPGES
jgi:hypothetical protein